MIWFLLWSFPVTNLDYAKYRNFLFYELFCFGESFCIYHEYLGKFHCVITVPYCNAYSMVDIEWDIGQTPTKYTLGRLTCDFIPSPFMPNGYYRCLCLSVRLPVNFTLSTRYLVTDLISNHQSCTKDASWVTHSWYWNFGSLTLNFNTSLAILTILTQNSRKIGVFTQ